MRSIPACAGEPLNDVVRVGNPKVYPRVCGGTDTVLLVYTLQPGLSPRVRGNRRGYQPVRGHGGSIPACAGEPGKGSADRGPWRVYPRVCGGTQIRSGVAKLRGGLSPRVRGNLGDASIDQNITGSIPACAGEPRMPTTSGQL